MVNKKGFIRTLEAVIAIVIILGLIIYLTPSKKLEVEVPSNIREAKEFILKEILINEELRDNVENINGNCKVGELKVFLDEHVPVGYDYSCEICIEGSGTGCGNIKGIEKDIYSGAVYLHSKKVFRLFMYEK